MTLALWWMCQLNCGDYSVNCETYTLWHGILAKLTYKKPYNFSYLLNLFDG